MKQNAVKKGFMIFLVMVLCLSVTACNGATENSIVPTGSITPTMQIEEEETSIPETPTQQTTHAPTQKHVEEPEFQEPTYYYYYAAVQGAVIVEQDGTKHYTYYEKCEKCGTVRTSQRYTKYGGSVLTSFYCNQCKAVQQVEIEETVKMIG